MNTINDRIRQRRKEVGLSLEYIADAIGISYQAVQQWERKGGTTPRRKRMQELSRLLQTTVQWLETGAERQSAPPSVSGVSEPLTSTTPWAWPFKLVSIERIGALSEHELGFVEGRLLAAIEECEVARPSSKRQGNGNP